MSPSEFEAWCKVVGLEYNPEASNLSFCGEEYTFRIPIGDYQLQLDHRIKHALSLLPTEGEIILARKCLEWEDAKRPWDTPLDCLLRWLNVTPSQGALVIPQSERMFAFVLAHATNRWGKGRDSLSISPVVRPDVVLYVPGSPESVFVLSRTLFIHDACVEKLKEVRVPAYGPHVKSPIPEPVYEDQLVGKTVVAVNRNTGKPTGAGSDESVLLPEFLPPR